MARYLVRYVPCPVSPSSAFPRRATTPRPLVPIILAVGGSSFSCYTIVDSGADDCLFPYSFGQRLGLDSERGRYYEFSGAGPPNQAAWFFDITVSIGPDISYETSIGFSPALEHSRVGLLGQNGFFDRFEVGFDLRNGVFYFSQ